MGMSVITVTAGVAVTDSEGRDANGTGRDRRWPVEGAGPVDGQSRPTGLDITERCPHFPQPGGDGDLIGGAWRTRTSDALINRRGGVLSRPVPSLPKSTPCERDHSRGVLL